MKDDQLLTFTNDDIGEIRGFIKNGEPWFLAANVCRALGIKDASQAVKQVEERLKIAEYKGAFSKRTLLQTRGGKQTVITIPEPFLYELIFASRKKKAIKFRTWVTSDVLPSIREHGSYRINGKILRHELTDSIRDSGENERMHGHGYSRYTILINKSLGLPNKNSRDNLSSEMLENIAHRENLVKALIDEGKTYGYIKYFIESLDITQKQFIS